MSEPRGLRLKNPGNLEKVVGKAYKGEVTSSDPRFREFRTMYFGTRAMMKQVMTNISRGLTTLATLIDSWAPPNENDTSIYVSTVCEWVGMGPRDIIPVDYPHISSICRAICRMEQGRDYLTDDDLLMAWEDLS